MGRGLNSTRLRRQKRRLRLRVQKPRRQQEVSRHQGYGSQHCPCEPPIWPGVFFLARSLGFISLFLPLTEFLKNYYFLSALDGLASFTDDLGVPPSIFLRVCSNLRWLRFFPSTQRLQQENHELRRGLAARGAEWEARAVELEGDVETLRAQLGEQRSEQRDSGRERARALGELSEQNLRLSQQLAQVGWSWTLERWGLPNRSSVGGGKSVDRLGW